MTERMLRRTALARTLLIVVVSVCCLVMFVGFIDAPPATTPSPALTVLALPGGLWVWATLYGVAGLAGLVLAVWGCKGTWVILFVSSLFGSWGFTFLTTWAIGVQPRGYLTGTWFLTMNVLTMSLLLLPSRRTCRRSDAE